MCANGHGTTSGKRQITDATGKANREVARGKQTAINGSDTKVKNTPKRRGDASEHECEPAMGVRVHDMGRNKAKKSWP